MEYCNIEDAKEIVAIKFANAVNNLRLREKGFQMPTIVWRDMGVRRAGNCNYSENVITLNSNYLKSKSWKEFLDDTPLHELAHAIAWQLFDETGHKQTWKNVCYQLGLNGNRCHSFEKPEGVKAIKRQRQKYTVGCSCSKYVITSVRYNRMLKGVDYFCRKCKEKVELI